MVNLAEEPNMPIAFDQLPLSPETLSALNDIGYKHATPVQVGSIEPALAGRDLMIQSQTGTGKTAAFSLPLIEKLKNETDIGALILAPTRELARQVMQEAQRLSSHIKDFTVSCVYGGVSFDGQVLELKAKPNIVVGTPGRVLDHLRRKTLVLKRLQCFVLDEADEMLSMGFAEDLEEILKFIPKQRQTLFFSATFPANVKRYAKKTLQDPLSLSFLSEASSADDLEHYYMMLPGVARNSHLRNLILELSPERAIIFTNTRKDADRTAQMLNKYGLEAHKLSGDMDQGQRDRVMQKMKDKKIRFLVATDVAARGIDISQLTHVFHYQLPDNPEVYIHRSGRTGRAGAKGFVYSLASSQDLSVIYALKRFHHLDLQERALPSVHSRPTAQASSATQTATKSKSISKSTQKIVIRSTPPVSDSEELRQQKSSQDFPNKKDTPKVERRRRRNSKSQETAHKNQNHLHQSQESSVPTPLSSAKSQSTPTRPQTKRVSSRRDKTISPPSPLTQSQHPKEFQLRVFEQFTKDLSLFSTSDFESDSTRSSLESQIRSSLVQFTQAELQDLARYIDRSEQRIDLVYKMLFIWQSRQPLPSTKASSKKSLDLKKTKSSQLVSSSTQKQVMPPRLHINLGWKDLKGGHSAVQDLIAELGGLLPEDIKHLSVKANWSLFTVDQEFQDDLIEAISGEEFSSKILQVQSKS